MCRSGQYTCVHDEYITKHKSIKLVSSVLLIPVDIAERLKLVMLTWFLIISFKGPMPLNYIVSKTHASELYRLKDPYIGLFVCSYGPRTNDFHTAFVFLRLNLVKLIWRWAVTRLVLYVFPPAGLVQLALNRLMDWSPIQG